tara:strand:+ start:314 stop:739 length:426 start_codon:yes stop_codon:yes gene_type:complete
MIFSAESIKNMNELMGILGAGLMIILLVIVVTLLVFTFAFRYSAKSLIKKDVTFWMSLAIVVLGIVASIGVNFTVSFIMGAVGLSEIAVLILGFIISFCATSYVYLLMLKTNFWKASLIQIATLIISVILMFGLISVISLF